MKNFFSLSTFLIIIGLSYLGYLGYNQFYLKDSSEDKSEKQIINEKRPPKIVKVDESMLGERGEDVFSSGKFPIPIDKITTNSKGELVLKEGVKVIDATKDNSEDKIIEEIISETKKIETEPTIEEGPIEFHYELPPIEEERTPKDPSIPIDKQITETPINPDEPEDNEPEYNGTYTNNTYNYSISYPPAWPVKVRRENNISIGTVPPKNGLGAITIEIASDIGDEIEEAKAEALRYPGILTISEEPIILDGTTGTKMTLENSLNNLTDIYIYLQKNGIYYVIKYSEESESFVKDVKNAIDTFSFN